MKTKAQLEEKIKELEQTLESRSQVLNTVATTSLTYAKTLDSVNAKIQELPVIQNSIIWLVRNRKIIIEVLLFIIEAIQKLKTKDEDKTKS